MANASNVLNSYFETHYTKTSPIYKFFARTRNKQIYVQLVKATEASEIYNFYIAPMPNRIIKINNIMHDMGIGRYTAKGSLYFKGLNHGQQAVRKFSERCYGDCRLGYMRME